MTLRSFRALNPDWDMYLGRGPANAVLPRTMFVRPHDFRDYHGPDYTDRLADLNIQEIEWPLSHRQIDPVRACDLFEWHVLGTDGGFFADMDIVFIQPMQVLPAECRHSSIVMCNRETFITMGFLAAEENCQFFRDVLDVAQAPSRRRSFDYQSCGVVAIYDLLGVLIPFPRPRTRISFTLSAIRRRYPGITIHQLDSLWLYPWKPERMGRAFRLHTDLPSQCMAIHWYGGYELSQVYNAGMDHKNFHRINNTISAYAAKIIELDGMPA